jgi:hypothetical protein
VGKHDAGSPAAEHQAAQAALEPSLSACELRCTARYAAPPLAGVIVTAGYFSKHPVVGTVQPEHERRQKSMAARSAADVRALRRALRR